MTLNSPIFFNYYYCTLALCNALRRVCCTSFCRNPVLKLLHARTGISCDREKNHKSHPSDHNSHVEYEQSVSLTVEKHTHLSVTGFILQGEKKKSFFSAQIGLRIINPSVWPSSQKHFVCVGWSSNFVQLSLDVRKISIPQNEAQKASHKSTHLVFKPAQLIF